MSGSSTLTEPYSWWEANNNFSYSGDKGFEGEGLSL